MERKREGKFRNAVFNGVFMFYFVFLVENILFKYVQPWQMFQSGRYFGRSLNLVPFRQILSSSGIGDLNIYGNIILFVPLGIYLMFYMKKSKTVKSLAFIFILSLFFESFQYVAAIGATDIDDIILNCLGGLMGIICYKFLVFICRGKEQTAKTAVTWIAAAAGLLTAVLVILLFAYN
ncbi:VanZ family protein [Anaerostipes sp.]|uniref:VanZ family protein n=1 Tax=Anaerostipes sp. TaxID=1872530 RepID=UPI0025C18315|nr:VanZ family protein [Anaerostipes sp.]MBS7009327.1 VanZ family protein [Anaerostipes sp.]